MNINRIPLDINLCNENDLIRYKKALNSLQEGIEDINNVKIAFKYKTAFYSMIICNFFNDLFGEGTHEILFGDCPSYDITYNALEEFYNEIVEQKKRLN